MSPAPVRVTHLLLAIVTLASAGCVVMPPDGPYRPGHERATVVYTAPPAPLLESRGWPPAPGYVWIDGYWNWGGARYVWTPGRWVEPRPNHVWVPRAWRRDGERWHSHGGHWQPSREDRRAPSAPIWQRREPQFQPQLFQPRPAELGRRPELRSEPRLEPHHHLPREAGVPPPTVSRFALPQPPVPAVTRPAPESRRTGNFHLRPHEPRSLPAAVSQESPPRPEAAAPQRRGSDDSRRSGRKRPEAGEPHDRR